MGEPMPPIPQGVFGVCEGCGAVAWELLNELSPLCLDCDPASYKRPEGEGNGLDTPPKDSGGAQQARAVREQEA